MFIDPGLSAETNPDVGFIVATVVLEEDQVPLACELDKEAVVLTQAELFPVLAESTGVGFTVTVKLKGAPTHDPRVDVGVIE